MDLLLDLAAAAASRTTRHCIFIAATSCKQTAMVLTGHSQLTVSIRQQVLRRQLLEVLHITSQIRNQTTIAGA
jgi:hypothetical protein